MKTVRLRALLKDGPANMRQLCLKSAVLPLIYSKN